MNTIILYETGGYGTFLEWLLYYLTDSAMDDTLPFRDGGNSHSYVGNYLLADSSLMDTYSANKFKDGMPDFARTHPTDNTLEQLQEKKLQIVNVWHTTDSRFWIFNNSQVKLNTGEMSQLEVYWNKKYRPEVWEFLKRKNEDLFRYMLKVDSASKEMNAIGYGYPDVKTEQDLARWQLREILSLWNFDEMYPQYFLPPGPRDGVINVQIEALRDNFKETIMALVQATGHEAIPDRADQLDLIGERWKEKQTEINRDRAVIDYVENTVQGEEYTDLRLSFFEEAWIQGELRRRGYEINCDGLNQFPSSTKQMNKLIYEHSTNTERV